MQHFVTAAEAVKFLSEPPESLNDHQKTSAIFERLAGKPILTITDNERKALEDMCPEAFQGNRADWEMIKGASRALGYNVSDFDKTTPSEMAHWWRARAQITDLKNKIPPDFVRETEFPKNDQQRIIYEALKDTQRTASMLSKITELSQKQTERACAQLMKMKLIKNTGGNGGGYFRPDALPVT